MYLHPVMPCWQALPICSFEVKMKKMQLTEIWAAAQTAEGAAILLRPHDTDIIVPIFIGQLESQSILIGREGVKLPRPLTHDLFLNLLANQKLSLKRVEIHAIVENTFHARLIIIGGEYSVENPLILDSRPSDAFALAVRCKCPIYVSSQVIKQTGIPLETILDTQEINEAGHSRKKKSTQTKTIRMLHEQLNAAVAKEEYEQAAEIRDMIKKMEDADNEN